MARVLLKGQVKDRAGSVLQNARVYVYEQGTTTPVTDLFAAESGGSAIAAELLSNSQGEVQGWLSSGRYVDLYVTDNSGAAYYPSSSNVPRTFTPFTETVAVGPRPDIQPDASMGALPNLTDVDDTATPTSGHYLRGDGTDWDNSAILEADIPATIARDSEVTTGLAGKQDADSDLSIIAALDSAQSGVIASDGAGWIRKTYAALKTALGIVKGDLPASIAYEDEENTFTEPQNFLDGIKGDPNTGHLDVPDFSVHSQGGNAYFQAEEVPGAASGQAARMDSANTGNYPPSFSLFSDAGFAELKLNAAGDGFDTDQGIDALDFLKVGGADVATQTALAAEATSRAAADTALDSAKVDKATYDANSILKADSDNTPMVLAAPASTFLGRAAAGGIDFMSVATAKTLLALVKGDVGLGNVDNTSDANKPVSTAQQTALDAKVSKSLFDANTILAANSDDTPAALSVAASRFLGRKSSGDIAAMTVTEALALLTSEVTLIDGDRFYYDSATGKLLPLQDPWPSEDTNGVETLPRWVGFSTGSTTAGTQYMGLFTARKTLTVSNLIMCSASPGAAGATLCRMGLWSLESNGDLILRAWTASDTTLFVSTDTVYTRALSATGGFPSTYQLVRGNRYALGVLGVGWTTAPTLRGTSGAAPLTNLTPSMAKVRASLSEMADATVAQQSSTSRLFWARAD